MEDIVDRGDRAIRTLLQARACLEIGLEGKPRVTAPRFQIEDSVFVGLDCMLNYWQLKRLHELFRTLDFMPEFSEMLARKEEQRKNSTAAEIMVLSVIGDAATEIEVSHLNASANQLADMLGAVQKPTAAERNDTINIGVAHQVKEMDGRVGI